jgi:class 3 adenylate cyclase
MEVEVSDEENTKDLGPTTERRRALLRGVVEIDPAPRSARSTSGPNRNRRMAEEKPRSKAALGDRTSSGLQGATDPRVKLPHHDGVQSMTLLFLDIVDSTALTEQLGDEAFRRRSRKLDQHLRALVVEHHGRPVEGKVLGDGILAIFMAAKHAIACALQCNVLAAEVELQLHLGLHAGDVIQDEGNVYGGAVNIAARVAAASAPGEVLVSETVRALSRTSTGVSFEDRGSHSLKGVAEAQRLFAVRERNQ